MFDYPTRAWHFTHALADMKLKALLNRYLAELLQRIELADAEPIFGVLGQPGLHEDYLDEVRLLPMRMLLRAWGFSFDEALLQTLYDTSVALVKSFDNYSDEASMQLGEEGMAHNRQYVTEQFNSAGGDTLLGEFARECREQGCSMTSTLSPLW